MLLFRVLYIALRASPSAVFALKQSGWDLVHFSSVVVDVISSYEAGIKPSCFFALMVLNFFGVAWGIRGSKFLASMQQASFSVAFRSCVLRLM